MTEDKSRNPVLAGLFVLLVVALFSLLFLRVAPNRLVSGQPVYFSAMTQDLVWLLLAALCLAVLVALFKPCRRWLGLVWVMSAALLPSLLWLAASYATSTAQAAASITSTSFGSAFWLAMVLLAFMTSTARSRDRQGPNIDRQTCRIQGLPPRGYSRLNGSRTQQHTASHTKSAKLGRHGHRSPQ